MKNFKQASDLTKRKFISKENQHTFLKSDYWLDSNINDFTKFDNFVKADFDNYQANAYAELQLTL